MNYVITGDQIQVIRDELKEVVEKVGPYKMDQLNHAWSVMDSSTEHAKKVLALLDELEPVKGETC